MRGIIYFVTIAIATLILAQFIDGRYAFVIGLASILALSLWRLRRANKAADSLGLTPSEIGLVEEDLKKGNREAAVQRVAVAQERQRGEFQALTGVDPSTITPVVGGEVSWRDVVRQVFRVREFNRGRTKIGPDNQVQAASLSEPYGYLLVESPILNQPMILPIVHRDDFRLATFVFDEPRAAKLLDEAELLVTYAPKRVLPNGKSGSTAHMLHYVFAPRGTLAHYYSEDDDVHMSRPEPEKLFGAFVYKGMLRIQICLGADVPTARDLGYG